MELGAHPLLLTARPACPIHHSGLSSSGSVWVAAPDSLSCLFPSVNLWKIYKAVEKLGAYELVRKRFSAIAEAGEQGGQQGFLACRCEEDQNSQVQPECCGRRDWCFASQSRFLPTLIWPTFPYSKTLFA